mgnify:CR=1 FL=1
MADKIYSRPRIRFKSFQKMNRKEKLKFWLKIILISLFIFIILILRASYPIFIATCENAATSCATNILNKEVNEVMLVYNYNDLVNLGKDQNGNITYIEAKIMPINEIVARITKNIQEKLDLNTFISVNMNFGSISRI